jgi:hypothetical protein
VARKALGRRRSEGWDTDPDHYIVGRGVSIMAGTITSIAEGNTSAGCELLATAIDMAASLAPMW